MAVLSCFTKYLQRCRNKFSSGSDHIYVHLFDATTKIVREPKKLADDKQIQVDKNKLEKENEQKRVAEAKRIADEKAAEKKTAEEEAIRQQNIINSANQSVLSTEIRIANSRLSTTLAINSQLVDAKQRELSVPSAPLSSVYNGNNMDKGSSDQDDTKSKLKQASFSNIGNTNMEDVSDDTPSGIRIHERIQKERATEESIMDKYQKGNVIGVGKERSLESLSENSQQQTAVMRLVNSTPQILVSQPILQSAFEAEYNDGTKIAVVSIESTVSPNYYLVGKGINNGESRTMGILLVYRSIDSSWVIGTSKTTIEIKHSCAGNSCISCDFAINSFGVIIGCNCAEKGDPNKQGYCNHRVYETTTNPGFLGNFY